MPIEEGGDRGLLAARRGPSGAARVAYVPSPRGTPDRRGSLMMTATRAASSTALIGSCASRRWMRRMMT